jgi:hypothetical protein
MRGFGCEVSIQTTHADQCLAVVIFQTVVKGEPDD